MKVDMLNIAEADDFAAILEERFPWLGSDDPESAANALQSVVDLWEDLKQRSRG